MKKILALLFTLTLLVPFTAAKDVTTPTAGKEGTNTIAQMENHPIQPPVG